MSQAKPPPPMKYFLAAFGPDPGALDSAAGKLSEALAGSGEGPSLGSPDFISADLPLTETGYYEREMGPNLVKRYMAFPDLAGPELLPLLKLASRRIEDEFSASGHRTVNLDPGYVFEGGLVLSTFKFSGHRLYLGRGVWGELTLHFHRGRFEPLPWTYRDYMKPEVLDILGKAREALLAYRSHAARGLDKNAPRKEGASDD